jgi:hypothetical protein
MLEGSDGRGEFLGGSGEPERVSTEFLIDPTIRAYDASKRPLAWQQCAPPFASNRRFRNYAQPVADVPWSTR